MFSQHVWCFLNTADVFSTRLMFSQHGWCFLNTGDVFSPRVMFSQHGWCFLNTDDVFSTRVMFSQHGWRFLNTDDVFSTWVMFSQHGWCFLNMGDVSSTWMMFVEFYMGPAYSTGLQQTVYWLVRGRQTDLEGYYRGDTSKKPVCSIRIISKCYNTLSFFSRDSNLTSTNVRPKVCL